ncbi:MAG: sodium:solute symporter family protein [bacterium]|nr:sodium:solute symporter family protein [bacterium]
MLKLNFSDFMIISVFFLISIGIGLLARKSWRKGNLDFFVASRTITLPAFVASTVSSFYGGILGVAEYSYQYGLSNWFVFGVPYYLYALIFAFFLSKKVNESRLLSIPDQLEKSYDKRTAILGGIFQFVTAAPGAYLLMITLLIQMIFPIPFWCALLLGLVVSTIYILNGGLRSVIYADLFLFCCMYCGFIVLVSFSYFTLGGFSFIQSKIPQELLTPTGGQWFTSILVWYFIASSTLVEPTFYQRCFSAKSPKVAKTGMILSVVFWFTFDFLTTVSGLYSRALFPQLEHPAQSYGALASTVLPPILRGFFWVSMFATIMSTINSYTFVASVTIGRDVLWRWRRENLSDHFIENESYSTKYTQIGLLITVIVSAIIASTNESIVQIWLEFGSIFGPALLLPLLTSWSNQFKLSNFWAFWAMITTSLVAFIWTFSKRLPWFHGDYFFNIEPIYPAIIVALLFWFADRVEKKMVLS